MRLIVLSLASALAVSACAEQDAASTAAEPAALPASPASPRPGDASAEQPSADACGAAERQDWIGRERSSLPSAPAGANWRFYETGQPVTQDLRPDRLNIEIDPERQTVVRVACG